MTATAHHRVRTLAIMVSCGPLVAISLAKVPFIRWIADDFTFANGLRDYGFWGFQKHLYLTVAGRVTAEIVLLSATAAGRAFAFVVPLAILAGLVLLSWRLASLATERGWIPGASTPLAAVLLVVCAVLETAPDRYQPVYWLCGAVFYGLPVLLIVAAALWATQVAALDPGRGVTIGVIALIAAGCSETAAVCQVAGFTALLIARGGTRKFAAACLLGSLVGLLVVAASPGNAARRSLLAASTRPMPVAAAVPSALGATAPTLLEMVKRLLPYLVLTAAITAARPGASAPRDVLAAVAAPCSAVAASLAAGYYSMGSPLPNRAMFVPNAWVAASAIVLTIVAARRLPRTTLIEWTITLAAVVATILGPLRVVSARLDSLSEVRAYANATDALDQFARAHRGEDVITPTPRSFFGLTFVTRDETAWPNTSVAAWYRLRSICWRDVPATTVRAAD